MILGEYYNQCRRKLDVNDTEREESRFVQNDFQGRS